MKYFFFTCILFSLSLFTNGQGVKVGTNPGSPHASAGLEVDFTDKGLLPPRMTSEQRDAISNPSPGLRIYNTDTGCENFYNGMLNSWMELCGNCVPAPTTASAGSDQTDINGTTATMAGNTPGSGNTGVWSITSGSGGNFSGSPTSSAPNALFTGVAGNTYVLRWTISNNCSGNYDEVTISFLPPYICGVNTVTDVQGNVYNTVQIGSQCWMKQNLKATQYRNGTTIPYIISNTDWVNNTSGAYTVYDFNSSNINTYGILYNWYAATNANELCPTGWHIPSDTEWTVLADYLGGQSVAGGQMKTTSGWNAPNGGATNSSGFTGLPAGFRYSDASFGNIGSMAYFWTTTAVDASNAYNRYLHYENTLLGRLGWGKNLGISVRCVRD